MKLSTVRPGIFITQCAMAASIVFGIGAARADDFTIAIRIPVNIDHLSPKVGGLAVDCIFYDAHGKNLTSYQTKPVGGDTPSIDPNVRRFNGTITTIFTFDQDQAMKIDWGSYICNLRFAGLNGYPSVDNPNEVQRLLPGAVVQAKGSLF